MEDLNPELSIAQVTHVLSKVMSKPKYRIENDFVILSIYSKCGDTWEDIEIKTVSSLAYAVGSYGYSLAYNEAFDSLRSL